MRASRQVDTGEYWREQPPDRLMSGLQDIPSRSGRLLDLFTRQAHDIKPEVLRRLPFREQVGMWPHPLRSFGQAPLRLVKPFLSLGQSKPHCQKAPEREGDDIV